VQYQEIAEVKPGDPVEWLLSLPSEVAMRLKTGIETLERLDAKRQPELAKAIRNDILGIVRAQPLTRRGSRRTRRNRGRTASENEVAREILAARLTGSGAGWHTPAAQLDLDSSVRFDER
jgi:hypothetical protein